MNTRNLLLIIIGVFMLTEIGCKKTDPPVNPDKGIEDLVIPDGFTFETTKEVYLFIKMPQSLDFTDLRSRFSVYSANPEEGGKLLTSGSFDKNGEFDGRIRVPVTTTEIFVESIAGSIEGVLIGQIGIPSLKEDGVIIDFGDEYGYTMPDSLDFDGGKSAVAQNYVFKNKSNFSSRTNIIENGDFETNDFGTIPRWNSLVPFDYRWHITQHSGSMEWYNDGGNNVLRTPWTDPDNYYFGGVAQMIDAEVGEVITFSADIKSVGQNTKLQSMLYIIPYNSDNNPIKYFYLRYNKPSSEWTNKQIVATMPSGTDKVEILIYTKDKIPNASIYFDNVVVTGPVNDSDGDGVDDDMDDYPDDSERAFNVYYPNDIDWGTLVYEDLWPGTGDYDFNDLVVDYQFKSVLNSQNGLVEIFTDYSVRAIGASLNNAFGFMLGGNPDNVASVSGSHIVHGNLNLAANGTELGQSNTVIFMFDDAFDMIGSSGSAFINTKQDVDYVEPDTAQVYVYYETPVSVTVTGTAPYNPFIVANLPQSRGVEIHLPGNLPSDLADLSLFGQWADDTNPAEGKYYQSANNLPWALDLPVKFDYPLEQVEIISAYNHFVEWGESGGNSYPDWYEDLSGYRNNANIYNPAK